MQKRLEKMAQADIDKFCEDCTKELVTRLLGKVVRRTPVGRYPKSSGKLGGTLRRGWTAKNAVRIVRTGNAYCVDVTNAINYSSYVEFGHRTSNHKGWVAGRFMMTISVQELESQGPAMIEKKLIMLLGGIFDGK